MRLLLLMVVLVAGCKKPSRAETCDELARLGVAVANELGKQLGNGKDPNLGADPEIRQKMAELKAECMTWPDEVFTCMRNNDETSPKCVDALAKMRGVVATDLARAPEGPAIVASADLGDDGWEGVPVVLLEDGWLLATPKDGVVAFDPKGAQQWRVEVVHDRWLLELDGTVLVGDRNAHALVALERLTGAEKWRAAIPVADGGDEYDDRSTEGAVRVGERVLVAIADGRFLRVDKAACAKKAPKCLTPAFALADETLDAPALVAVGDTLVIGEDNALRRFTTDGTLLATIHVRDTLGGVVAAGSNRIAASMDDELVVFDLARCEGGEPVGLARKRGRMYMRGEGECDGCRPPPAGCLVARAPLPDVDSTAPTALRDGALATTTSDGPAHAAADGAKRWVAEVDAVGPLREVGDHLVFVSRPANEGEPVRVVALSVGTGKVAWTRALPAAVTDISYNGQPIVETAGPWLVAGAKGHVSWLRVR